jgi:hypothetical protein
MKSKDQKGHKTKALSATAKTAAPQARVSSKKVDSIEI